MKDSVMESSNDEETHSLVDDSSNIPTDHASATARNLSNPFIYDSYDSDNGMLLNFNVQVNSLITNLLLTNSQI